MRVWGWVDGQAGGRAGRRAGGCLLLLHVCVDAARKDGPQPCLSTAHFVHAWVGAGARVCAGVCVRALRASAMADARCWLVGHNLGVRVCMWRV